jgi:hypothetical protein
MYSELLTAAEETALDEMVASDETGTLAEEAKSVGLRLDAEDLDALIGYERFLRARRSIQVEHLGMLKKGVSEPVVELPFLFSAGLDLPDIETLADSIEERIAKLGAA